MSFLAAIRRCRYAAAPAAAFLAAVFAAEARLAVDAFFATVFFAAAFFVTTFLAAAFFVATFLATTFFAGAFLAAAFFADTFLGAVVVLLAPLPFSEISAVPSIRKRVRSLTSLIQAGGRA